MRKWVVAVTALCTMSGCASASEDEAPKDVAMGADSADGSATGDGGSELDGADSGATGGKGTVFPACDPTALKQRVSFVHVNDLQANYQFGLDGISPVARIRGYVDQMREQNPYTVFTNGGDDYEKGSVADQLSQGKATTAIIHGLQFDVRVIGNHDYAWSEAEVLANSRDPYAHVLSSNIHYTGADPKGFGAVDFVKLKVGCLTVGFAGFTSKPWDSTDNQYDGDFYPTFPAS
jgi:5'-nucleotidase/UDP-sugar diphosphatase